MSKQQSVSAELEAHQIQLPPILQKFLSEVHADRKKLLRDKAFSESEQLRQYIGQFLYQRFEELVQLVAGMAMEAYGLAASNTNELRRLHAFTVNELNDLGANLNDDNVSLPGVSPEVLDEFQARLYALGTLLQDKYPEDKETQDAYNAVASSVSSIIGELMGDDDYDDDSDDDDSEDSDSEDSDSDEDDVEDVDPKDLEAAASAKSDAVEAEDNAVEAKKEGSSDD